MSKPLRLTIHPRLEDTNLNAYEIHQGHRTTLRLAQAKRLTEAELCAEYWRHEGDYRMLTDGYQIESFGTTIPQAPWMTEDLERDRVNTLHRFATHPHYFEATEPESDTE